MASRTRCMAPSCIGARLMRMTHCGVCFLRRHTLDRIAGVAQGCHCRLEMSQRAFARTNAVSARTVPAGTDLIKGSWIFKCMAIAPNIRAAITAAAGSTRA